MELDRLLKIINEEELKRIKETRVLIVGIGGVGGYALEALVRMGVSHITIVDSDTVDITNLNRQIIALHSNIGKKKALVAKERILDINENTCVSALDLFLNKDNIASLPTDFDYIIDACDTVTTKLELVKWANKMNIKIISAMGTGNKFDPTKLEITDIFKTNNDPLAKVMRRLLRENGIKKLMVVASKELPIKTNTRVPGSTSLVPSVAGIYCASYIINDILNKPYRS